MKYLSAAISIILIVSVNGDIQAKGKPAERNGVYFTIGAGLGSSYYNFYDTKDPRKTGPAAIISTNVAIARNRTLGLEFDGYFGNNLNLIFPLTQYIDDDSYVKIGPSLCRVGYDYAAWKSGFGLALGVGADLEPGFTSAAAFSSIVVNANFIIQRAESRNSNYFSLTVGIRFSSTGKK